MIHTVKDFPTVNKADVDVFLEFPYFFHELMNADNLISGSSTIQNSACTSGGFQFT